MPGIVLMENAARQVAEAATAMLAGDEAARGGSAGFRTARGRGCAGRRALVVCGGGNNGGDGLAATRHLHNAGVDVVIALTRADDDYEGDAAVNLAICRAMRLDIVDASGDAGAAALDALGAFDLVLDGLLGTGLSSEVRGPAVGMIEWINAQGSAVLAIDIPSGLDCDTGEPLGIAVRAARTVTFVAPKRGFEAKGAAAYTGEVLVADIGAPIEAIPGLGRVDGESEQPSEAS